MAVESKYGRENTEFNMSVGFSIGALYRKLQGTYLFPPKTIVKGIRAKQSNRYDFFPIFLQVRLSDYPPLFCIYLYIP